MSRRVSPLVALALAGLGLLLYLPGLGREILRHPLEAKYALAAREMLRGGPLLVARLFGELYPDKPPLYFWATAGLGWLGGGIDEATARLPAVGAAVLTVLLVYRLGTDLFSARAGMVAGGVLATGGLFFWYARQGHPDQFLTAWVTLAGLAFWRSFTTVGRRRAAWVVLAYAAMGLGVMSKGLLGLLLPLLAAGTYLLATVPIGRVPSRLGLWPGLGAFLAVVLAWYAPAVAQHGIGYLRETIVHQHVVRYVETWVHKGPWYYYVPEFTAGFFPWSLFVPGAIVLGWRRRAADSPADPVTEPEAAIPSRPFLFPLGWFAAGFVFFSLSTSKRGAYLLPLYPAAALMVGWLWAHVWDTPDRSRWIAVPITLLAGAAAVLAVGLVVVPKRFVPGRMVDTLVPAEPWLQAALALLLLGGGSAVWWAWRRGQPVAALAALVTVQSMALLAVASVRAPQYEARYPARELATRIGALAPADGPILSLLGDYDYIVAFYLDRPLTPLPGPSELLAARGEAPRYALVDDGDREALRAPGVHPLAEGQLGPKRVILIRLDPRSR